MKKAFCPKKTLLAGHFFCYDEQTDGSYVVINGNKQYIIRADDNYTSWSQELQEFFDLKKDLDNIPEELHIYSDVRLVRQELRQAIITFITTANNNQKRIKKLLDALRTQGEEIAPNIRALPEKFSEEQLRNLGFGYRAKTLAATNKLLTKEFLEQIKSSKAEEQRRLLLSLPGVGPKVADCIMAYSELACPYAFPQDVWVMRAVKRRHKLTNYSYEYVRSFAKKRFKEDASYVQHYYFLDEQTR